MVNGTTRMMGLNETAAALARERGYSSSRNFSVAGRAIVELRGELASELWDVGAYDVSFNPTLTQDEQGPYLLGAYAGRLPDGNEGHWQARKMIENYSYPTT